ncbi:class I SAM-dependent methyltransferase [Bdellovibrio sp. HCB2-146]|uniref:class I SAM-dependent methyltransferase n=1 Tax=Bdellovibrio sp. HCB2-146 TaxID=3394362 RepID=UPI0039BCD8AC
MILFGSKDIKFYVNKWLEDHASLFAGKTVLDLPAGNGVSSDKMAKLGAKVHAGDLFPEFFRVQNLKCEYMDLAEELPFADESIDFLLCQEGIEHVSDQFHVFEEFNRVLSAKGRLLITTPNYSNLRARMSYLLNESELFGKIMPPNEVDSVWFSPEQKHKIYFGHVNLIGIQRLRLFAKLAGFDLVKVHPNRVNYTALMLFPIFYPFIAYFSWASYRRMKRKQGAEAAERVKECFKLAVSPEILLQGHLIVEFAKAQRVTASSQNKAKISAHEFTT